MAAGVGCHRGLESRSHFDPMMFMYSSPFTSEALGNDYGELDRQGWGIMFNPDPPTTPPPAPTETPTVIIVPTEGGTLIVPPPSQEPNSDDKTNDQWG